MPVYRIKVDKPEKKGPHSAIIEAPSIASAEYYAIERMLLAPKKAFLDDHFKLGVLPVIESINRSKYKSIFRFGSDLMGSNGRISNVKIILDNQVKPSIGYDIEHDDTIFELWKNEELEEYNSWNKERELPFFTTNDLDYFSSVIGKKFPSGDASFLEIGETLTNRGVFAKTDYWAELLKRKGYKAEFKNNWQHSGRIKRYSWARIFPKGSYNKHVFFTVGVGSRFTENEERVSTLEYKLDCRRNKRDEFSQDKIQLFDEYVAMSCPEASRQVIEAQEIEFLNWDVLIDKTSRFIDAYSSHFKEVIRLIDNPIPAKLARICWNEKGWEEPSGSVGKSKSSNKAFEKDKGYGYEEWFFDTEKQIDEYHYSFLQQFNKGDHEGNNYELFLYSLKKNGASTEKYWIGHIKVLEVLTKEESKAILNVYKEKGWYREMLEQLKGLGIGQFNFEPVLEDEIFNVKYKVDTNNYIRYDPYRPIKDFEREVKGKHYVLLDKQTNDVDSITSGKFIFNEGHNSETTKGSIVTRNSGDSYVKNLRHREIQEAVYNQLAEQYSNSAVKVGTEQSTGQGTLIDLVVHDPKEGYIFYEIKTGSSALGCIREAIGQVFEYCYYPNNNNACKLVIIAPHPIDFKIKQYMQHLKKILPIRIYYQYYSLEKKQLEDDLV